MSKKITATIANTQDDEKIRLAVGEAIADQYGHQVADNAWATGVTLDAVYVGRRWFVVESNSIWDRGNGQCVGTYYVAYDMTSKVDQSDILGICEKLGIEPPASIVAVEA